MQNSHISGPITPTHGKAQQRLINPERIKNLLSKKLSTNQIISNPQQILQKIDHHIHSQVERVQSQILKNRQRQNKIKMVQTQNIQTMTMYEQKLKHKLQRSKKKKLTLDKEKLSSKIKSRELKEEFFTNRKQEIQETQFRKRLEQFKLIKAENQHDSLISNQSYYRSTDNFRRSSSVRSSLQVPIQKSQQLQEIQYFRKLQLLQKRRIYDKPQKIISTPKIVDKTELIQKINSQTQHKFIQKLGLDLLKIEQARMKKEKMLKEKINKIKNQSNIKEEYRSYKMQDLKQLNNTKMKTHRDILNRKNERFLTMRNKSSPHLQRNWSRNSQNRDTFQVCEGTQRRFQSTTEKMSRTLQNFKQLRNLQMISSHQILQRQKQGKLMKEIGKQLQQLLRKQKTNQVMKLSQQN